MIVVKAVNCPMVSSVLVVGTIASGWYIYIELFARKHILRLGQSFIVTTNYPIVRTHTIAQLFHISICIHFRLSNPRRPFTDKFAKSSTRIDYYLSVCIYNFRSWIYANTCPNKTAKITIQMLAVTSSPHQGHH